MKNKMILLAFIAAMAGACNNSEELPSTEGTIPRDMPGPGNIDSMHRYPPVPETETPVDSMLDPRTGKPKTPETDTI